MEILKVIILIGVVIYVVLTTFVYMQQRKLQYHPNTVESSPEQVGLMGFQKVSLPTSDGETILAWYHPAPKGRPTILYFHGNAGGVSGRSEKLRFFADNGFGFMAVSYRGYEGSSGSPTEVGMVIDAKTAYGWLISQNVRPVDIAVLGESIGTGVAIQLIAQSPVGALALEAPYYNAVDVGAAIYWFLPVRILMIDQFRSSQYIAKVRAPILIIHGQEDQLIPYEQGQKLYDHANQPKQFISIPNRGHELIFDPQTWQTEVNFFNKIITQ
jgi:uncharacterized protein